MENLSLAPDMIDAVKQSAVVVHNLPDDMKTSVIAAYVGALRAAYTSVIPMGILCFISTIFMGNHKPKKKEGEDIVIAFE